MASSSAGRILVTGALGQIGTELVHALRARLGTNGVVASDIREIAGQASVEGGPFRILDVLDKDAMEEIITGEGVDTIYHLAAILSAVGEENPALCQKINIGGLSNVLDLAREHKLRVFAPSSIAVFGPDCPKMAPQDAELHPTTVYGVTKVAGELMADYYHDVHGVDVRGLRYPGLISWKAPAGGGTTDYAVEIFHAAIESGSFSCYIAEDTRLPMMYMDDAIRATLELMDTPADSLGEARAGYNLAGVSFSAGELAEAIAAQVPGFVCEFSPDVRQKYANSWPDDVDDSPARADWGWKPRFGLRELVTEMVTNLKK
jgi:nucleoside-diphosphate-sugar epimerase